MPRNKKVVEGTCHICGYIGEMSPEHVPPQSVFELSGMKSMTVVTFRDVVDSDLTPNEVYANAKKHQGGYHPYTLCYTCNHETGKWYAPSFVIWCRQGMEILNKSNKAANAIHFGYDIFPLRVLKQVVTMFFSTNDERFGINNPDLVKFVKDREARYLPPDYRFFVYFNPPGGNFRIEGMVGIIDTNTGKSTLLSEIAYPPFGFVMASSTGSLDYRPLEITHFSRYGFYDRHTLWMRLPVLQTHTSVPGDYRDFKFA